MNRHLGIHEELHLLILRSRWIKWSLRNYEPGCYKMPDGKHIRLSARLSEFAPTWEERQEETVGEMDQ